MPYVWIYQGTYCKEYAGGFSVFESEEEAKNYANYIRTRFFRFLVALRKNTQHATKTVFKFVPKLDMTQTWSDEKLYKKFDINKQEQEFIASIVREMGLEQPI